MILNGAIWCFKPYTASKGILRKFFGSLTGSYTPFTDKRQKQGRRQDGIDNSLTHNCPHCIAVSKVFSLGLSLMKTRTMSHLPLHRQHGPRNTVDTTQYSWNKKCMIICSPRLKEMDPPCRISCRDRHVVVGAGDKGKSTRASK